MPCKPFTSVGNLLLNEIVRILLQPPLAIMCNANQNWKILRILAARSVMSIFPARSNASNCDHETPIAQQHH